MNKCSPSWKLWILYWHLERNCIKWRLVKSWSTPDLFNEVKLDSCFPVIPPCEPLLPHTHTVPTQNRVNAVCVTKRGKKRKISFGVLCSNNNRTWELSQISLSYVKKSHCMYNRNMLQGKSSCNSNNTIPCSAIPSLYFLNASWLKTEFLSLPLWNTDRTSYMLTALMWHMCVIIL